MGIRAKIVVPFTALFLAALVLVAVLAARASARVAEERLEEQLADLAAVLSQAGFAGNRSVLEKVKTIVGGELATVDGSGRILATTLTRPEARALERLLMERAPLEQPAAPRPERLRLGERSFRGTFAPVEASHWHRGRAYVFFLTPEARVREAVRRATRPIVFAAVGGAVAVVALGYVVGHLLARPVEALAAQARALAADPSQGRLEPTSRDEVGELARAFNAVLESLRNAEERLVASERLAAVGQVAAGIAHEVRNPLSGIKMEAQLLGKRLAELGAGDEESLQVMLAEIARLEVVIEDLLTFAHPGDLELGPGDLNEVIASVLDFMSRQLTHSGIQVHKHLDPTLPPATMDPRRIRQVVLNLVLNAADAMPTGGTLTVSTERQGDKAVAHFDDTGRGISPEVADKVFEPFFTTKPGGSGLGLAVSRTIVEAHGGRLTFQPLEPGTRFTFDLPLANPSEEERHGENPRG